MQLEQFIEQLGRNTELDFEDTMAVIGAHYHYQPAGFHNGDSYNEPGSNEGSCKIFAFAQLHQLSPEQTLACFGRFYRDDVLNYPAASDHANIRNFMRSGWAGVRFEQTVLTPIS